MTRPPGFIHAGAPKAGSTWLYAALAEHPGVHLPPGKELQFFDKHHRLGEAWYERQFAGAPAGALCGDISPEYLFHPAAAARIAAYDADVKILVTLREPVRRMLSWRQQRASLGEPVGPADAWLTDEAILARHRYVPALARFLDAFPRGRIHVDFHETLRADPQAYLDAICDFLGIDRFTPSVIGEEIWGARDARSPLLTRLLYRGGQALRAAGLARLVGAVGTARWFTRLVYRETETDRGSVEARRVAHDFFAREFGELEALTGRTLPESWRAAP